MTATVSRSPTIADAKLPTLDERLRGTPYDSYVYAYPHKTAYGPLEPQRRLADAWRAEDKSALFLYLHVPFCEMRCGFCNLFTTPKPADDVVRRYVEVLERQALRVADALGAEASYSRFAMGGGTPTLLNSEALTRVLDVAERIMGADLTKIAGSVETSPETCSREGMAVLRERGVDRISMGVQSFVESETRAVNRPQKNSDVLAALEAIRDAGFPTLNLDLIYGLPEQTMATWEHSLRAALAWKPEELFLYPLYVRPVTTLSRRRREWDDDRLAMYRYARDLLVASGYRQVSMRMFQRREAEGTADVSYCVQDDGMVGLGPGARSYTRGLHYSTEWAVGARGVKEILGAWLDAADDDFGIARWGFDLDADEQRRRWIAYALFVEDGLDLATYRTRFGEDAFEQLPMLQELIIARAADTADGVLRLTPLGVERSDTLGPWLYSASVRAKMRGFALR